MVKEKLMEKYDWQQRTALLLGEEKMERIRNAHVLECRKRKYWLPVIKI